MIRTFFRITQWTLLAAIFVGLPGARMSPAAELSSETIKAWNAYITATESRRARELASEKKFLALDFQDKDMPLRERRELLSGEIPVIKMTSVDSRDRKTEVPDGMIHYWRGSVFIPGVTLDAVYARVANPTVDDTKQDDVLESAVSDRDSGSLKLFLKLQRSKIVTVVYNTEHQVHFQRPSKDKAWSRSFTTKIAELKDPGTPQETEKPEGKDHGFLWRLNSYWRYQQVDGGVIVECESISLSRSIPAVFRVLVRPLIDKVAHESMERTLDSMRTRLIRNRIPGDSTLTAQSSANLREEPSERR